MLRAVVLRALAGCSGVEATCVKLSWIRRMLFTVMQGGTVFIAVDACRQHCDALVPGAITEGARSCSSVRARPVAAPSHRPAIHSLQAQRRSNI